MQSTAVCSHAQRLSKMLITAFPYWSLGTNLVRTMSMSHKKGTLLTCLDFVAEVLDFSFNRRHHAIRLPNPNPKILRSYSSTPRITLLDLRYSIPGWQNTSKALLISFTCRNPTADRHDFPAFRYLSILLDPADCT
jgi:hypothetical protein